MDKKLLRSVREYKKQSFLTPVLVAAEVFVEVLIPLLMAKIIDVGIMNGDMAYIIKGGRKKNLPLIVLVSSGKNKIISRVSFIGLSTPPSEQ